jgi:hypothetical protein
MKYRWTRTPMGGLKAEVVGKELERLGKDTGELTPELLVQKAKPKNSLLHPCFEWDNTVAAEQFRISQARYMLRSIEVVIESDGDENKTIEIRAFHNVQNEDDESVYVTVKQARENPEYWEQIKEKALSEIHAWKLKYQNIKEFEKIFDAIESVK